MTIRLVFAAGLLTGILLARAFGKRTPAQPVDSDRDLLDSAGMGNRFRQYDAEFNLERKHGKQS